MAGTKNKTTHKHNYKVTRDEPYVAYTGIEMRFIVKECLCGKWEAGFHYTYDFVFIPDNIFNQPLTGVRYKVINP
jgi:hypothetical protein